MNKFLPSLFIAILYFVVATAVIQHYGVNWDSPWNYQVGNSMLHYLLTGERTYVSIPDCQSLQGTIFTTRQELLRKCPKNNPPRSVYQDDEYTLDVNYKLQAKGGHPRSFSIVTAISNTIFYRLWGVLDDTDSYRFPVIVVASLLIAMIGMWSAMEYGVFASVVSSVSLAMYPFLFGETQINFKDPPEAFFFALSVFLFYIAVTKRYFIFVFLCGIGIGLALGVKLNIVFLPFIVLPWLLLFLWRLKKKDRRITLHFLLKTIPFIAAISFLVLFVTWPYLWEDPEGRLVSTISYYLGIGTGKEYQDRRYYFFGFNSYPFLFFLYTTPVPTLLFLVVGIVATVWRVIKEKYAVSFLWLLLFVVPLLRLMLPGLSSYGGIRQAIEFAPGMALLCGFGAYSLRSFIGKKRVSLYLLFLATVFAYSYVFFQIVKVHPFENQYFNELIGGVKGAHVNNFQGWENSFGNGYYQGVRWINAHAEKNARLAFSIVGEGNNLPVSKIRPDIQVGGKFWSGIRRQGEYIIEMNVTPPLSSRYSVAFERLTLNPVHVIQVDGEAIGYIYKNDITHTKDAYRGEEKEISSRVSFTDEAFILDSNEPFSLSKLQVVFEKSCQQPPVGTVEVQENGRWVGLPELFNEQLYTLPEFSMGGEKNERYYYFLLPKTSSVRLFLQNTNLCRPQNSAVTLYGIAI